jgi:hypothetical protein
MLDSKFFFTLVGLVVTVFAICNTNMSGVSEGFSMAGKTVTSSVGNFTSNSSNMLTSKNNSKGANINYNMQRVNSRPVSSKNALDMADMVSSGYDKNKMQPDDSTFNVNDGLITSINDMSDISMTSMNSDGNQDDSHIYDRLIVSNLKSRLATNGCPIRGDVVPCITDDSSVGGAWFSVHPTSNDLSYGALGVMGGMNNENLKALANHKLRGSGGMNTLVAGVDMSQM